jgi:hypothetical protein
LKKKEKSDFSNLIGESINQSGLSATFTSGVTDFDTFIAVDATHAVIFTGEWFAALGVTSATLVYDMGASFSMSRLAIWNEDFDGIDIFTLEVSDDSSFTGATVLGPFNVNDNPSGTIYRAQVITFPAAQGRFVRMNVRRADGATISFSTAIGEIAFETGPVGAVGDPHFAGANGIKFDVYGKPAANYSLVVAPAFEINMQLANNGPELRFMTAMAVLYRGTSFVIKPWTIATQSAELTAHFEALGAKVNIDTTNWLITIELCAQHTIVFATRHSGDINFLNLEVREPGCHNGYGGLLGQTYQCKYAHEKFEWSREREEAFRVATLETASGTYSPEITCAHADEYSGNAIRVTTSQLQAAPQSLKSHPGQ